MTALPPCNPELIKHAYAAAVLEEIQSGFRAKMQHAACCALADKAAGDDEGYATQIRAAAHWKTSADDLAHFIIRERRLAAGGVVSLGDAASVVVIELAGRMQS